MSKIAGGCEADGKLPDFKRNKNFAFRDLSTQDKGIYFVDDILTPEACQRISAYYQTQGSFAPVSIQGRQDIVDDTVGSNRITCWDMRFADQMWEALKDVLPTRTMLDTTATDWWQHGKHREWEPIGVSPMVRYMKYTNGGQHYAHYDAGFIYPESEYRTLMSGVLYLTTNDTGATCIIDDKQATLPIWKRNLQDWVAPTPSEQVLMQFKPVKGSLLLFDHRICHNVSEFIGNHADEVRIIIRLDILFHAE